MFTCYTGGFKGIFDSLGIADNAKFIFSPYKRLTKNYKGNLVKVKRTSDSAESWFGYDSNGDLDTVSLLAWVGASDGLVMEVANQYNDSYNASQSDTDKMPKIVSGGVLESSGLLFDGIDDYLEITDYSDIQITSSPLSVYVNLDVV